MEERYEEANTLKLCFTCHHDGHQKGARWFFRRFGLSFDGRDPLADATEEGYDAHDLPS